MWSIQKKQRIISTVLLCFAFDNVLQILGTHFLPCRANETCAWYVCSSFTKYVPRLYQAWIVRACSKWQFFFWVSQFPIYAAPGWYWMHIPPCGEVLGQGERPREGMANISRPDGADNLSSVCRKANTCKTINTEHSLGLGAKTLKGS